MSRRMSRAQRYAFWAWVALHGESEHPLDPQLIRTARVLLGAGCDPDFKRSWDNDAKSAMDTSLQVRFAELEEIFLAEWISLMREDESGNILRGE